MTEKQAERLKKKIKRIKLDLAADKREWGGFYDDSRGLRYVPPQYYVKLGDYDGGLKYFRWFNKNFPDDIGFPDFLFECTIILFKTGKIKEAEKKAFETYCRNSYIFAKFFDRPIVPFNKYESSNSDGPEYTDHFIYSSQLHALADFSEWLDNHTKTVKFKTACEKYVEIFTQLKTEDDFETRGYLIDQATQLVERY
jgi:hypothetical protein